MRTTGPRDAAPEQRRDDGFTLIEVVVALGMLAVIASAALAFFIQGVRTASELQRRQAAVALASAAIEDARSVAATMVTTGSGGSATTWPSLAKGRDAAAVTAQWGASTAAETASTYPASDPDATAGSTRLIALSTPDEVSGQDFTTSVLIGTCYRQRAAAAAPCTRPTGVARTATPPTGYVEMVRVIAQTTWDPGAGRTCSGAPCSYSTSILVDPSADPTWSTSGGEAVDDVATIQQGTSQVLDVLANDAVIPASSSPVTVTAVPTGLTAVAQPDGRVTVSVAAGTTPAMLEVRYTVRNSAGATTNEGSVYVTVTT